MECNLNAEVYLIEYYDGGERESVCVCVWCACVCVRVCARARPHLQLFVPF
jgi:hypothetical protein